MKKESKKTKIESVKPADSADEKLDIKIRQLEEAIGKTQSAVIELQNRLNQAQQTLQQQTGALIALRDLKNGN